MKRLNKRGQVAGLSTDVLALVIAATFLVFGIVMSQEMRDTQITGATGCNATGQENCGEAYQGANSTVFGLGTFADFWEIIVLAIVIGVVVGILLTRFGRARR